MKSEKNSKSSLEADKGKEEKNDTSILHRAYEVPVVNSRYSIVMATSKRARQIIAGEEPLVPVKGRKPLSIAVDELNQGKIKIMGDEKEEE